MFRLMGIVMLKGRNSKIPALVECTLLLIAIAVVVWGLQGKLSLYQGSPQALVQMNSSAKLTTGETSSRANEFVERQGRESAALNPIPAAVPVVLLRNHGARLGFVRRLEVLPRQGILFGSPDMTLRRRPPPLFF
jgi:hypothetical protein